MDTMKSLFTFLKNGTQKNAEKRRNNTFSVLLRSSASSYILFGGIVLLLAVGIGVNAAFAQPAAAPAGQASPLHPTFALLDGDGVNVLDSGGSVSTMQTCGQCHDTAFIASHSFHANLGMDETTPPGPWNPLTNQYLLPDGDVTAWAKASASRLVGGTPTESLGVEMDCFLCHTANPNNAARIAALQAGQFEWVATATLLDGGLVEQTSDAFTWNTTAFDAEGKLLTAGIQDPTNENCAQCHGVVHTSKSPLTLTTSDLNMQGGNWQTLTTGQVISPDKISNSGMNQAEKDSLTRSWDIHAERGLKCTDCHYALNNPAYYQSENRPDHLQFDPRRLEIGEYLQKPDHNFARGQSAQDNIAPELKGSMRRCESCHDATKTHAWLPYADRHLQELACESCHIPQLYAPAVETVDWTVLQADGTPRVTYRGVEGGSGTLTDLVTGYQPVLLPRQNVDGKVMLAPYNLITTWAWVGGEAASPVTSEIIRAAWFEGDTYAPEIVQALDADGNEKLTAAELLLDTPEKQAVIAKRLTSLGVQNPRIVGQIQPYSINHNVTENATQDCKTCHSDDSRLAQPIRLAASVPAGVDPQFAANTNTTEHGTRYTDETGALYYKPATQAESIYIFGHNRVAWVDILGALLFVGVLVGVAAHGGLRFYTAMKAPRHQPTFKKVYMYAVYERFWHWLQTFAIVLLLFTGLIIHRPDVFGIFSFHGVVVVHNVLAALLVINAALSLFYHLVSGEIKQYIPHPYGFFDEAIVQAKYYIQGIFRRDPHPFEKTPDKKLNPLQRITYFGILNVLLPLQIVTGALMWGVQQWPAAANLLGGLPLLAPFHSLVAWTFASFIVGHVYLTTTGAKPLTAIQAMMTGWETMEEHEANQPEAEKSATESKPTISGVEASAGL
jgi:thiosulfate reductase cytochrome b subunit